MLKSPAIMYVRDLEVRTFLKYDVGFVLSTFRSVLFNIKDGEHNNH